MAEQIYKLSPHRDLQCYFFMPSAIAAMSEASDDGFVLSGRWRQQFDWAVVEWNRDNVFEHPALRYLPDGDLSGLTLTYQEERTSCIPFESNLFAAVDWNNIRIWAPNIEGLPNTPGVTETVYHVDLAVHPNNTSPSNPDITPLGTYVAASVTMTLVDFPRTTNDLVGIAWLDRHHYYTISGGEDLPTIAQGIIADINATGTPSFYATWDPANPNSVTVTWKSGGPYEALSGANGNRIGIYGFCSNGSRSWEEESLIFSGGQFPSTYQVTINFGQVAGYYYYYDDAHVLQKQLVPHIPTSQVRRVRWTWAADLEPATPSHPGTFQQKDFQVRISNWSVTGNNRIYSVAGPGSRRIEDTNPSVAYSGLWTQETGNYSSSKVHSTEAQDAACSITYSETASHYLYLGTRLLVTGGTVAVSVDGQVLPALNLALSGDDVLIRLPLGAFGAGTHSVTFTLTSPGQFWFDFLEVAYPSTDLPDLEPQSQLALATDWDTYHSQSLPAERTAWLIHKLGFRGRVNHYTGALWFYELVRTGTQYASVNFHLTVDHLSDVNAVAQLDISGTTIDHVIFPGDTSETLTQAFAFLINNGSNSIWASASGNTLTITARAMGTEGNGLTARLGVHSTWQGLSPSSASLSGGVDGAPYDLDCHDPLSATLMATTNFWRTDLTLPRLNRAARDWHRAFFEALKKYNMDAVAAFSTELLNGDPSAQTGIAQRYWDGTPVILNTPAIQTNFSPASLAFWTQVYVDMASLQNNAGLIPYLQSGEVQWWYFPKQAWVPTSQQYVDAGVGMPLYDEYTKQQFQTQYGLPMQQILGNDVNSSEYANEIAFLPTLIAAYTAAIRSSVRTQFPDCQFEVLYPTDTNSTNFNQLINYPEDDWTPENLDCLKTESFTFTNSHRLDLSSYSISVSRDKGFTNVQRSHLVGIGDAWTAWMKEVDLAQSQGLESVVLFALDQYCLIGYPPPPFVKLIRSQRQG
jgi:hypothetical protein